MPYFFEDIFDPLPKRYGSFSFLNLCSQQSKLLFSLCDSFLGSHSFQRRSVLIVDERYVFFILAPELSLLFIQFIEGFRGVEPVFKSVSILFFRREGASESVNPRLFLFFVFNLFLKSPELSFFIFKITLEILFQLLQSSQFCFTFKIRAMFFLMCINTNLQSEIQRLTHGMF